MVYTYLTDLKFQIKIFISKCVCVVSQRYENGKLLERSQASNVASEGLSTPWCDRYTVVQPTCNSGLIANQAIP